MQLANNILVLRQIEVWETLFDWLNDSKNKKFAIEKNEKCILIGKQELNSQTLYKLQIKSTGKVGWVLIGQYPCLEII